MLIPSVKSLRRMAKATKVVESMAPELQNGTGRRVERAFWAKITAVNNTTGGHSWRRQVWDPAAQALTDDPQTITGTENAWDVSGARVTTGSLVWLEHAGFDGSDAVYRFDRMPRSGLFACKVVKTSGSAGDATTQCSFVYTVKTLDGTTIGTGLSPLKKRAAKGAYVAPADNSIGTAYYDETGALKLWDPNEVLDPEAC